MVIVLIYKYKCYLQACIEHRNKWGGWVAKMGKVAFTHHEERVVVDPIRAALGLRLLWLGRHRCYDNAR